MSAQWEYTHADKLLGDRQLIISFGLNEMRWDTVMTLTPHDQGVLKQIQLKTVTNVPQKNQNNNLVVLYNNNNNNNSNNFQW